MCVIIHKPDGVRLPPEDYLMDCWTQNPNGAGVMWRVPSNGNKIAFTKGFMTFRELRGFLNKYDWKDTDVGIHFRITTHGGTCRGNCHPFACWRKGNEIPNPHTIVGNVGCAFMHNGVLPVTPRKSQYSDSGELALRASAFPSPGDYIRSIAEFVEGSNRILLFEQNATTRIGHWQQSSDPRAEGCFLSNLNHERWAPKQTTFSDRFSKWAFGDEADNGHWERHPTLGYTIWVNDTPCSRQKTEAKPESKPEAKPEAKPESKSKAKPESKPEAKDGGDERLDCQSSQRLIDLYRHEASEFFGKPADEITCDEWQQFFYD